MGASGQGRGHEVCRAHHQASRGLLHVRLASTPTTSAPTRPPGRDLVREYVDAFRAEGLHIGFYYSLIDWHHPDFPIDHAAPAPRRSPTPKSSIEGRDMHKYAEYMRNQVTELLTNYGKIDILWFDFSYSGNKPAQWQGMDEGQGQGRLGGRRAHRHRPPPAARHHHRQPHRDRAGSVDARAVPAHRMGAPSAKTGELVTWEACQTFSGSWGYYRDETTWKSPEMLIRMLINTVSCGGNLLMNVGPTSRGYLDYRAEDALKVYADWMKYNSRSIYGCTMAEPDLLPPLPERLQIHPERRRQTPLSSTSSPTPSSISNSPASRAKSTTHSSSTTAAKSSSKKKTSRTSAKVAPPRTTSSFSNSRSSNLTPSCRLSKFF